MTRPVNLIVIHCSATKNGDSLFRSASYQTPVGAIDDMHRARGFRRDPAFRQKLNPRLTSIGYHFVIYTSGLSVTGRHLDEVGAHVLGNNKSSIGICVIGTDKYSKQQWDTLEYLVTWLRGKYPNARVMGHRDLSPDKDNDGVVEPWEWLKTCPGFSVADWLKGGMLPLPDHIWEPE